MSTLEQQLEQLETLAAECHATAPPETVHTFCVAGFPVEPGLRAKLEEMSRLAAEIHANPEIEFRRSPRGFYLTVFPLLAQALIRIFEDGAPEGLPTQARRGHIARRLFGLPDDLSQIASGADSWADISGKLAGYVDGVIAANWAEAGEEELARFYEQHGEAFLELYRTGYSELTGQPAPTPL